MTWADGTEEISNYADLIDSREVIARIAHLQERDSAEAAEHNIVTSTLGSQRYCSTCGHGGCEDITEDAPTDEERQELESLRALASEASGYAADWEYGETLIRDSYFQTYAQELAEDCGMINADATWPNDCIDWERAARELQMDYTSVSFAGVDYWIR